MWEHLRIYHNAVFFSLKATKEKKSDKPQPTIDRYKKKENYPQGSARHKSLNDALINFVAAGKHAFNIVEQPYFKKFISELDPQYACPSETTVRTTLLDAKYDAVMAAIK